MLANGIMYSESDKIMKFVKYTLVWISSNLSIPFWMIGHVHLTMNAYKDIYEILASLGMNIIVGVGFWISWKDYLKEKN
jgi:hypothetical protein